MASKYVTIQVDPDEIKRDVELQSTIIRLAGRKALDAIFDTDTGFDFTEEELESMPESEYLEKEDAILLAMSKGRIKKK